MDRYKRSWTRWLEKSTPAQRRWAHERMLAPPIPSSDQIRKALEHEFSQHPDNAETRENLQRLMQAWRQEKHKKQLTGGKYNKLFLSNEAKEQLDKLAKDQNSTIAQALERIIFERANMEYELDRRLNEAIKNKTAELEAKFENDSNRPTEAQYRRALSSKTLLKSSLENLKKYSERKNHLLCHLEVLAEKTDLNSVPLTPEEDVAVKQRKEEMQKEISEITGLATLSSRYK